MALVVCVGLLIAIVPAPAGVEPRAWRLFAIFVATIVGIIAKPMPMGAVALGGVAAALVTRTLTITEALSGFANSTVWLVLTAFFMAAGFIKTGLGARIAYSLVVVFGRSTLGLGYSLVATDLLLAPMIPSNTARAGGVVFPILQSLTTNLIGADPVAGRRTSAFLTLVAYNGTVVTSAMFLTGMVGNPLVAQLAAGQGIVLTWTMWALAASIPGLLSLAIVPLVIYFFCPPGAVRTPDAPASAKSALKSLGAISRPERIMALVSVVLLAAWVVGPNIGFDTTAAALTAVLALIVTGVLTWDEICGEREAWNTFIWFAVVLMMATYLGQFGLIGWFTTRVESAFVGIGWVSGFLVLSLIYFYSHYLFASNTTHVSAMYAPFLAALLALGTPRLLAALVLGFFSSLFASLTHYGTAPAPILFGGGHVTLGTWWKVGAVVSVVNITIWIGIGAVWWRVIGFW